MYVTKRLPTGKRTDRLVPVEKRKLKYGHNFKPRNRRTREDRYNGYIPPTSLEHVSKALKGYWRKDCSICGNKALYRAGIDAYCLNHKQKAIDWWTAHPMRVNFRELGE